MASGSPALNWQLAIMMDQSPRANMKPFCRRRPIVKDRLAKNFSTVFVNEVIQLDQIHLLMAGFRFTRIDSDPACTNAAPQHANQVNCVCHRKFPVLVNLWALRQRRRHARWVEARRSHRDHQGVQNWPRAKQDRFFAGVARSAVIAIGTLICLLALPDSPGLAQGVTRQPAQTQDDGQFQGAAKNTGPQKLSLRSLPEPPAKFKELIDRGKVRFEYGPIDDPRRIDSQNSMAAETSYKINFSYRTRLHWQLRNDITVVSIRITGVQWSPSHVVWFRKRPDPDSFWEDRLVRHEMDHVRISTDPRLAAAFRRRADELKTIALTRSEIGNRSIDAAAKEAVKEKLTSVFRDVTELASIRYRELDRVTLHGRRPLPEDSDEKIWNHVPATP